MYVWCSCNECGGENEINFDGDNPAYCPDCRSLDCFTEIEEKESPACNYCDPSKHMITFNRKRMCPSCREDYDSHLEDKADAERDERLISKNNGDK